jgi:hypothetical protein
MFVGADGMAGGVQASVTQVHLFRESPVQTPADGNLSFDLTPLSPTSYMPHSGSDMRYTAGICGGMCQPR